MAPDPQKAKHLFAMTRARRSRTAGKGVPPDALVRNWWHSKTRRATVILWGTKDGKAGVWLLPDHPEIDHHSQKRLGFWLTTLESCDAWT